jgi:hypothetical protein
MRQEIFLVGIIMLVLGPVITAFAISSCLGTILSGSFFACVSDFAYLIIGGAFFVIGILVTIVGLFTPDRPPTPATPSQPFTAISMQTGPVTCKKCGRVYNSSQYFCPQCGTRPT